MSTLHGFHFQNYISGTKYISKQQISHCIKEDAECDGANIYEVGYGVEECSPVLGVLGKGFHLLSFQVLLLNLSGVQTYLCKVYTAEYSRSPGKSGWDVALLWITRKKFQSGSSAGETAQLHILCNLVKESKQQLFRHPKPGWPWESVHVVGLHARYMRYGWLDECWSSYMM